MNVATCKSCTARFVWGKTTKGRMIPLDVDPERDADGKLQPLVVDDGNIEPTGATTWGRDGSTVPVVRVLRADEQAQASTAPRWRSHFASCPNAAQHSRGRRARGGSSTRWER